jgi:hypothetical protein
MAVTSSVTVQVTLSGDVAMQQPFSALDNPTSPGQIDIITLNIGNNPITPPSVVPSGLMIIPPAGNLTIITLKGINGDTGFPLNVVNPSYIPLDLTFTGLVLSVSANVVGVRLIWT